MKLYSAEKIAKYCQQKENNVKQTKTVKKLIKAFQNGNLEDFIK